MPTVTGTDNHSPIRNLNESWRMWALSEIYTGDAGQNRFVPKVGDYVKDTINNIEYIVTSVDELTLIPELQEKKPYGMSFSLTEENVIFGVGDHMTEIFRVYIDKTVTPYVLNIDSRWAVPGANSSYAKVFLGANASSNGVCISKVYDNAGNFISENIPLELVSIDSHINYSVKIVSPANTIHDLVDNDLVTVVIYNDAGHVVKVSQMRVENTGFIRSVNTSTKYIAGISLESPFMSVTSDTVIDFPLNVPVNALNLVGVVHYTDGSSVRLPVDGTKFIAEGIDQIFSSIENQRYQLTLFYQLDDGEASLLSMTPNRRIAANYEIRIINPNNSYSVKLFVYPRWIDETDGYGLDWWLHNLDRNVAYKVNAYVNFAPSTGSFNGKAYGTLQRKNVYINLNDVSGAFKVYNHVQTVDIHLLGKPDETVTPWLINNESLPTNNDYGLNLHADKISQYVANLSSGFTTKQAWLDAIYRNAYPLVNYGVQETQAPEPTHVLVTVNNDNVEIPIDDWDQNITFLNTVVLYKLATLQFIRRTASGDLILSTSALLIR